MDDRGSGGSFVAVRRVSQGFDRGNTCHSSSGMLFTLFLCICVCVFIL